MPAEPEEVLEPLELDLQTTNSEPPCVQLLGTEPELSERAASVLNLKTCYLAQTFDERPQ